MKKTFFAALCMTWCVVASGQITTPDASTVYQVVNSCGLALTNSGGTCKIMSVDRSNVCQSWSFVSTGDGKYEMFNVGSQEYLGMQTSNTSNTWSCAFYTSLPSDLTKAKYTLAGLNDGQLVSIELASNSKYLGTDATTDGSTVFCNKDVSNNGKWQLVAIGTSTSQVTGAVTVSAATDYVVTGTTPFATAGSVNLTNDGAALILKNVIPSKTLSTYLTNIFINGSQAVSGTNCTVSIYNSGTIVLPYTVASSGLTVYTGENFTGSSAVYHPSSVNSALGTFNNAIQSVKLRRGYMACLATSSDGTGYNRVYVANGGDLEISALPAALKGKVSYIRVLRWQWPSKKAYSGTDMTANALLNTTSFYGWNASDYSRTDREYVPQHHHEGWPAISECTSHSDGTAILGNNEPDNQNDSKQKFSTVSEVLANWPAMMKGGQRLGSPAVSSNLSGWLYPFIDSIDAKGYRCDFVAVHAYWYEQPSAFMSGLKAIYDKVKRPLWITEFNYGANWTNWAGSDRTGSTANYELERAWMATLIPLLDAAPYVERYFVYNWVEDCRKVYNTSDATLSSTSYLTPAGQAYVNTATSQLAYSGAYDAVPAFNYVAPYSLACTPSRSKIALTWYNANGEQTEKTYVERKVGTGSYVVLTTLSGSEKKSFGYTDADLTQIATGDYTYRIHNFDSDGTERYSSEVTVSATAAELLTALNTANADKLGYTTFSGYRSFLTDIDTAQTIYDKASSTATQRAWAIAMLTESETACRLTQTATESSPADFTFMGKNLDMESCTATNGGHPYWTTTHSASTYNHQGKSITANSYQTSMVLEMWAAKGTAWTSSVVHDAITGLPNGIYKITAGIFAIDQSKGTDTGSIVLFGNNKSAAISVTATSETDATDIATAKLYTVTDILVKDGTLTLGVKETASNANWYALDNVKVYLQNSTDLSFYNGLDATLPATLPTGQMNADVRAAMLAARTAWVAAKAQATGDNQNKDAILSSYNTYADAIAAAETSISGYARLADAIAYVTALKTKMTQASAKLDVTTLTTALATASAAYDDGTGNLTGTTANPLADAKTLRETRCLAFLNDESQTLTADLSNPTTITSGNDLPSGWTGVVKGNTWATAGQYPDDGGKRYLDSWAASGLTFTVNQTTPTLPAGIYVLSAEARTNGNGFYLYAVGNSTTSTSEVTNYSSTGGTLGNGFCTNYLVFSLAEPAAVTLGISTVSSVTSGTSFSGTWASATDFGLYNLAYTLDETKTLTPFASTGANVLLTRSLKTTWNTLCLPFDLSESQLTSAFGANVQLAELTAQNGSTLHFTTATSLTANRPCLVKLPTAAGSWLLKKVNLSASGPSTVEVTSGTGTSDMIGSYADITDLKAESTSPVYLISNNKFYLADAAGIKLKAYRAYFVTGSASVKAYSVSVDGEPTSIDGVAAEAVGGDVYNLNGQLVRKNASTMHGLPKGVYVVNGKKRIVK
jgi:hypothetical protein